MLTPGAMHAREGLARRRGGHEVAEVLGIGTHHTPAFRYPVEVTTGLLKRLLTREHVPAALRDPANWPLPMQAEWGDDEGLRTATEQRAIHDAAFRRLREELDAFHPDVVVIFGDDQNENFREEIVPPFCLHVYDSVETLPFHDEPAGMGQPTKWGRPADERITFPGHRAAALHLARELIRRDLDMPYAFRPRHHTGLAHAHLNTVMFLDPDLVGFPYPLVPISVNCLGSDVFERLGVRRQGTAEDAPPPGPTPRRAFEVGAAVRTILEASPWRAAIIGSAAWSHSFLTRKTHGLYPDVAADRARFAELERGQHARWQYLTTDDLVDAGQHEFLNWVCLAGAMAERTPEIVAWTDTYVSGAGKCAAVFRP
jgi:hypothetical protein